MTSLKKISLVIAALLLISCTAKVQIARLENDTLRKIAEQNRQVCSYKGRVTINYQDGRADIRLKGMLDKQCNKDFHLVILGPLNIVMADITYQNGEVKAEKGGKDMSPLAEHYFRSKNVDSIVELIRYPYVEVDNTYSIKADGGSFVLKKGRVTVKAGPDCMITEITDSADAGGDRKFTYKYDNGKMKNIVYEFKDLRIEIGLE